MGYRSRLGKVAKSEKVKFDGMGLSEVEKELGEDNIPYFPNFHTQLYELGKYFEFTKGIIHFYSFEIYEECEAEFYIMLKSDLKKLISDYHKIIYENYQKLVDGEEDPQNFLNLRKREWSRPFKLLPYYLDRERERCDGDLAASWQYEYVIFNLVYIYRTFDWENDYLIYSAW